jgi:hypothetical protein
MEIKSILEMANRFLSLASKRNKVYGPFTKKDSRQIVIIIYPDGKRRTVSYPKYLMEKKLRRQLDPNLETIHHKDGDHNNNDDSNLEIIPRKQHSENDTRRVKLSKFKCDMCGKKFERSPRLVRDKSKKGAIGIFCSRECSGRHNRLRQLGLGKELKTQPFVKSKYYKKRPVEAVASYLIKKYAGLIDG